MTECNSQCCQNPTITIDDINGILVYENNLYFTIKSSRDVWVPADQTIVFNMYPNLTHIKSADNKTKKFGLASETGNFIEIDVENTELIAALGIVPQQLAPFVENVKDNTYYDIVKAAGLENEYCLLFGGTIFHHSLTKAGIEEFRRTHRGLNFSEYVPYV